MLAQRHSSVFHAGVIGQGPRKPSPKNLFDKDTIALNTILLMDVIKVRLGLNSVVFFYDQGETLCNDIFFRHVAATGNQIDIQSI